MKIHAAYKEMEVEATISDEELKKVHKKLVKAYHPDHYKEDPEKLKRINSAYQAIQEHRKNPNPFGRVDQYDESDLPFDMNSIFNNFGGNFGWGRQNSTPLRNPQPIKLQETISFKESVLGVDRELSFTREVKCETCKGLGFSKKKNDCTHCDGFGHISKQLGPNTFSQGTCGYCRGKGSQRDCETCKKTGAIPKETKITVHIPPGIIDGNIIQLGGAGHFANSSLFGDSYSNLHIQMVVKNDTHLTINGADVIYTLKLSLLEALKGTKKSVPTVDGEKEIDIIPKIKNKEEISLDNLGVGRQGKQRVILDISYPENTDKLITALEEN